MKIKTSPEMYTDDNLFRIRFGFLKEKARLIFILNFTYFIIKLSEKRSGRYNSKHRGEANIYQ